MATFEVQGQDGKTYEVQADSLEQAAAAIGSLTGTSQGGSSVNPQAAAGFSSGIDALTMGAHNGAFFGFGDNLQGAKSALFGQSMDGGKVGTDYSGTMGERYARGRDQYRQMYKQAQDEHPMEVGAGNILGAIGPAIATAPMATGNTFLQTMARGAGIGAVEGGLQGAGNADGQDVLKETLRGAAIGGGLGVAAPAIVKGVGALKNAIKDPATGVIDGMFGIANKGKANRAVLGALKSSGNTADDIAAMLSRAQSAGQPEYRLMDALGTAGQRQASGLARSSGDAATEIANFLENRQLGQGERIGSFIDDAFGTKGTTAAKTTSAMTKARGDAADVAFNAARGNAAPVDVRGALGVIDARIGGMKGAGITGDSIDGKLAGYRARLAGDGKGLGQGVTNAELSDFDRVLGVKQSIQDDIGAALRAGRNNEARELGKLVTELDGALEVSSDMYRTANDGFREASKVIGAVDDGATMASRGRAADNVPAFQAMNPEMQGAARVGYGDNLLGKLEAVTAPTANRAKPLMSAKREAEAGAMTLDPQLYAERLARENDMWATQNRALGGSRTADNMADQSAISDLAGGAIGAAKSAANFQFGDVAAKLAGALGPLAKGQNEATRALIIKALMSGDSSVLAPVMRQSATNESQRRMIEALLRQPAREGINGLMR